MIYLIISDSLGRLRNDHPSKNKNKSDCLILRQPLPHISGEIKEYIEKAKNHQVRDERNTAYTSLLCSLKLFFDIDDPKIEKSADGKPFLKGNLEKQVFFNISHSGGMVALALSDEGDIGIDIQGEVENIKEKQLEERFLKGSDFTGAIIPMNVFSCNIKDEFSEFEKIDLRQSFEECFSARWTCLESVLKLYGKGFGSLSLIGDLIKNTKTDTRIIKIAEKNFYLSLSIFK